MAKCKHCPEEITWIDGKPYSLQNHFKVCRPDGAKKPAPVKEPAVSFGVGSATDEEQQNLMELIAKMER